MKGEHLLAKLKFNENGFNFFQFPLLRPVRISFKLKDASGSTFSEIQIKQNESVEVGVESILEIMIGVGPGNYDHVKVGDTFYLGTFPVVIAEGIVMEILG